MCTRTELLKLSTLPSQTCSINSSWLTGLPWLSRRYSNIPDSFRVSGISRPFAAAMRRVVSKLISPQQRIGLSCLKFLRTRLRTLASNSSKWKGFGRKSLAPASKPATLSPKLQRAERMSTLVSQSFSRIRASNSIPSVPGRLRSRMIRSYSAEAIQSVAWIPSRAESTS